MKVRRVARSMIPVRVRQRILWALAWPRTARLVSDVRSFRQLRRLENKTTKWHDPTIAIRVRALGGHEVHVRPSTTDRYTFTDTFLAQYHLPPMGISNLQTIWDLGANIGLTAAHFAFLYPHAHITGVELDSENAELAERNTDRWRDRCVIICAAVWTSDGEIAYRRERGHEQAFRVTSDAANAAARAISLSTLLENTPARIVDYVKMDIEGAERELLRNGTEWAAAVRSIGVEVHPPYTVSDCAHDLDLLGFETKVDDRHFAAVFGLRSP